MKYKIPLWKHQLDAIDRAKNKNHFALFFEMGCLASHTTIRINRAGRSLKISIEDLYRKFNSVELDEKSPGWDLTINTYVRSFNGELIGLHKIKNVFRSGVKKCLGVKVKGQPILYCTPEHKILTKTGWTEARFLDKNTYVAIDSLKKWKVKEVKKVKIKPRYNLLKVGFEHPFGHYVQQHDKKVKRVEKHRLIYEAYINGISLDEFIAQTFIKNNGLKFINTKEFHIHHKNRNVKDNRIENLECLPANMHSELHGDYKNFGHGIIAYSSVEYVKEVVEQMTYDIECEEPHHNFVANNIIVHNSGKTATSLQMMREKFYQNGRKLRTMIFCPPIVVPNWKKEIEMHTYLQNLDSTMLIGSGKDRLKIFTEKIASGEGHVFITNYESLYMKELFPEFLKWAPELLIFDESHKLKSANKKRSKYALMLAKLARYRFLLTGTPVLNSPMDLYGQFLVMDLGETFGRNFFAFRNRFFYDKNADMPSFKKFPAWTERPGARDFISKMIVPSSMRIKKEECLDLPPLVRQIVYVDLAPEQRKHYQSIKKSYVTYINDVACKADIALTKALRMQQIASGFIKLETGEEVKLEDTPRQEALHSILDEICGGHKVLVWACFKENYEQIRSVCKKLGLDYVEVHGEISDKKKQEAVRDFSTKENIRVLIGHPGSGGIGVNLVAASYSIFFSRSFSLEHDLQAESRNHRGGSHIHEKITRIDIVAKDTIDEHIAEALARKEAIGEELLRKISVKL